ncbi:MAG: hypothetical protein RLZZ528_1888 [Pseudomonadota bacterium]|jgi:uncharacterized membrane protein
MTLTEKLELFSIYDGLAVGFLVLAWLVCDWLIENPPAGRPSVTLLMRDYRRDWMREMVTRDPRIFDSGLIDSLRVGATFFASACMIAIGGGLAVLGNPQNLVGIARELQVEGGPVLVWQIKVTLVILFLTNALMKFIWAHRLFGYCAIVMASVPNDVHDPAAYSRAAQTAEINITGGRSYERALRSVYFGLGALGWLLGPVGLLATTCTTIFVILRREFASISRRVLLEGRKA